MSRQKIEINEKLVLSYAKLGATNVEIAEAFGCSEATIRGRFCEILAKGRAAQRLKLRRMQMKSAMKGNVTMLIWLGKNVLKQADKPDGEPDHPEPHLDPKVG